MYGRNKALRVSQYVTDDSASLRETLSVMCIGCPKLDEGDYADKLTVIIRDNDIKSITIVRLEVPCFEGLENAVKIVLKNSGKRFPQHVTFTVNSKELNE